MERRIFFSFHYGRDAWRAAQVRNSGITKPKNTRGYLDKAEWEKLKKKDRRAVQEWIDKQMKGTSVTVVLIGKETHNREYVQYEIEQSHKKGNVVIGIRIHNLKNQEGQKDTVGKNPFDKCNVKRYRKDACMSDVYDIPIYDWVKDDGYNNFSKWVDKAVEIGR